MEKVSKLIRSLLNRKALRLDGILNKGFKVVALIIIKDLVEIASHCFANKIILKRLKKSIIIVLRKEDFFLNNYNPITFKNTLIKVLKKYIVNIMSKAAEKHRLLL